jgi:oligoendopeptidase F
MRTAGTAPELHAVLAARDSLPRRTAKQYAWLTLRLEIDTRDVASTSEYNDFAGAIEPLNNELQRMLGDITPDRFRALAAADTGLRKYAYAAQTIRRNAAHQLDSATAQVAGSIGADATTWGPALFQSSIANTRWGSIQVDGRTLDFRRNGNELRSHRDRSVREQAYRLGNAGMESRLDVYAMILMREAQARNDLARLQKWPDYVEGWYTGDAARMERALSPDLAKRIVNSDSTGRSRLSQMSAMGLVQGTRAGGGTDTPAGQQQKDIRILDIFGNAASARATMSGWVDYMHLAKFNRRWVIVNVLWELQPNAGH